MRAIICNNQSEHDILQKKIHEALFHGIKDYRALAWSEGIQHQSNDTVACPVEESGKYGSVILSALSNIEKGSIVTLDSSDTDWFPVNEALA